MIYDELIETLRASVESWGVVPYVTGCADDTRDPFQVLISTILSLRTRDAATQQASDALFKIAKTPREMMKLPVESIAEAIQPAMYYNNKARTIREISRTLVEDYGGRVPDEIAELLKLKGVGRKTANLVVTLAYNKPGICVDTHVHRISNRLWAIDTKNPEQTEMWLRKNLPGKYWIPINTWMVVFGQKMCQPVSPWCSQCPLTKWCKRHGVARSR
ncbi:endonuclease III [bacterium]|nr:endonuclease III [bacterium]